MFKRAITYILLLTVSLIFFFSAGCGNNSVTEKNFALDFQLTGGYSSITCTTIYNDYSGFPYEGIAFYKVEPNQSAKEEMGNWNNFPVTGDASSFLDSLYPQLTTKFSFPEITNGKWCFLNRDHTSDGVIRNASFCVFDADNNVAYYLRFDS